MQYFDLHCDTLYRAIIENKTLNNPFFNISVDKGKKFSQWIQCMALWIPDDYPDEKIETLLFNAYNLLRENCKKSEIIFYENTSSIVEAQKTGKPCFVFTIENAKVLQGKLSNIELIKKLNVKIVTLTWNDDNLIGGGSKTNNGLTNFGRSVVQNLEKNNIVIDISHASEKLFYDVFEHTKKPVIATHSNSKYITNINRNLTDEQFLMLKSRNGIVGLNFHRDFLNNNPSKSSMKDLLIHTEHFLSLGGENILSIGSDFDGCDLPCDITGIETIYPIYNMFLHKNYSESLVQKIFYKNAFNFCENFDN